MAVTSLQITLNGSAQQISATPIKCRWVTFQNNAAAAMRIADANVSSTKGVSLASGGGEYSPPIPTVGTFGFDLSQFYVIGTSTQLLDVVYDGMNF